MHRVRWDGQTWKELWVTVNETVPGGFELVESGLSSDSLHAELMDRGPQLPRGWTSEVCPAIGAWFGEIAAMPFAGPVLILDYGFTAEEHFAPERSQGTLRRYRNHHMDDRVLEDLGD